MVIGNIIDTIEFEQIVETGDETIIAMDLQQKILRALQLTDWKVELDFAALSEALFTATGVIIAIAAIAVIAPEVAGAIVAIMTIGQGIDAAITMIKGIMQLSEALNLIDKARSNRALQVGGEKLKENYGIDFVFKESRKGGDACDIWKDDYGRKIIDAYVRPKGVENTFPYEFVYRFITSDDTHLIKDCSHAYFYHKQITDLASPLIPEHEVIVKDKSYIRIYGLERRLGKWTGKESFERYLNEQDFETLMYIYVKDGLSDDEYVDIIKLIIASIYSEHDEYNITLTVRKDDNFKDTDGTIGSYLFFQDVNQHPNLTPEHFTSESILWDISGQRFYNSH